jgi:thymidylate kinase
MVSIALIGPDGAGKTTIGRRLEQLLPMPVKYIYMGVNLDASRVMLPTTRLALALKRARGGRPDMVLTSHSNASKPRPKGLVKRAMAGLKSGLRTANWLAEEWYRQLIAWRYQRQGYVVIFDRHFFADYYAHDVAGDNRGSPTRRLHGFVLRRFYPRPDLVICLDAPAEVLYARKGEGSLEWLDARRGEYLAMRHVVDHFAVVDASQPLDDVARDVAAEVLRFVEARGMTRRASGSPGTRPIDPEAAVVREGERAA